jgi:hypothetical protein
MDLLLQHADIGKEEIVGEIPTIIGARIENIFVACGHALLGTANTSRKW